MKKEYDFILFKVSFDSPDTSASHASEHEKTLHLNIDGMSCQSCEIKIERKFRNVPGVKRVEANSAHGTAKVVYEGAPPDLNTLRKLIVDYGYTIHDGTPRVTKRPGIFELLGLFALVLLVGSLFSRLGLLKSTTSLGASVSLWAVFLLGLTAAASSCIAVSGGLLLSSAAKFNERYSSSKPLSRMRPVVLFVVGRVLGYSLFGALIGLLGSALSPSPLVTGVITVFAAVYMLMMGLDMLHILPMGLKKFIPRIPKELSRLVFKTEEKEHPLTPFLLGSATFFLPCGFTQALQLYALSQGSALTGGLILGIFAIGTAPALLALGWASGSLKGKLGQFFFKFSGALVIMLGLFNIQNGFAIAGYPLSLPTFTQNAVGDQDSAVSFDGRIQTMRMNVSNAGYSPNQFTIKKGVPTRWLLQVDQNLGCIRVLQSPRLGIRQLLSLGQNVIEFTPTEAGTVSFSCSMGMYRGQINVID